MPDIVTTDVVTDTVIESATFNDNFSAVKAVVNGALADDNINANAAIDPSKIDFANASGVPIVRGPFSFAYNTASLTSGVTVYTPTVNDILIDAWFEITTAFDGTTPKADIGSFSGTTAGLFAAAAGAVDLSSVDSTTLGGDGISVNNTITVSSLLAASGYNNTRISPSRFTAATAIKLVVSQDGLSGGAAIGGTAGAGKLYLVTVTPVAL